ncbi:MAG: AAA family ATPase [Negativicutes bacterium]
MKPFRIQIKNLGAIPAADIDLTGITLAAICGANGLGKSTAFTTAPRFALFGNLKPGTRVDDMVRTGTSEMSVIYDFEHQGDVWRVIRTRSTKGKGKSTLELQRQSGELWASESGSSIDETQKKIIDLLNLADETFVASSMILQGDAGNFSQRPAGQRKAILGQILQLDQYEDLQKKARDKVAATNISLERDKAMVAAMETRLAEQPQLQLDLDAARVQLSDIELEESVMDQILTSLRESLADLIKREEDAARFKKQAEEYRGDADNKKLLRADQQERLAIAESYLTQEKDILVKAADHDRIREQVTLLQGKDDQRKVLAADEEQVRKELDQVLQARVVCLQSIAGADAVLAERPALELAAQPHTNNTQKLTDMEEKKLNHDRSQLQLAEANRSIVNKKSFIALETQTRQDEIARYENRAAMLADAQCIDIEKAECRFLADAKAARAKIPELQKVFSNWKLEKDAELADFVTAQGKAEKRIAELAYDPDAHLEVKKQFDTSYAAQQKLMAMAGAEQLLATLNTQRVDLDKRSADLSARLETLREGSRKLNEDLAELPGLNEQLAILVPYIKKRELLPAIKEKKLAAAEQIKSLTAEIDGLTEKGNQAFALYVDTVPNGDQVQNATDEINNRQAQLDAVRKSKQSITLQIGALTAKLEALANDATERENIIKRMAPLSKELTRWQTLVKAFGRDGIPALIIENTVPELERIANEILGQMSGGKHNLRFETQRELKSKAGMAETLDIIVGDWAGERIYETFSGGEQLRIDFAIRFALAELLARRAGARVDWLTIDEGFGSQSDEYLPLVIEAVKSVASRFGMVLVISHVKQVQEAFEQTIVFRPDGESVEVRVA